MFPVAGATAAGAQAASRQGDDTPRCLSPFKLRGVGFSDRLVIDLHFAHGDLTSSSLLPSTNRRSGRFGGSLDSRLRFPLMLRRAVREAAGESIPVTARPSCTDRIERGFTPDEAVQVAIPLRDAGCDLIVASADQTDRPPRPPTSALRQLRFARRIRTEAAMLSMAWGGITEAALAEDTDACWARHFARRHVPAHRNAKGRSSS